MLICMLLRVTMATELYALIESRGFFLCLFQNGSTRLLWPARVSMHPFIQSLKRSQSSRTPSHLCDASCREVDHESGVHAGIKLFFFLGPDLVLF